MLSGLLFSATIAHAASYDPELTWRTLQTEHFNITFHGGEEQLAQELADIVEQIHDEMTAELAWAPRRRTEVVLVDNTDSAMLGGDLAQPAKAGLIDPMLFHADLAELCQGRHPGRQSDSEFTLFKSAGTALEDLAAADLAAR